jgi:hypothetical protein
MDTDATDMPIFLTPYLLVEGAVAEVVDCLAGPMGTSIDNRIFTYHSKPTQDEFTTMYATLDIYATYGIDTSNNQLIGWLIIERIRKQCHLEMRAIAEHQQLACDVLLSMPASLNYLSPVIKTNLSPWEIINNVDLADTTPSSAKKAKRATTQIRYAKLYKEASPLIESGMSRSKVAEQLKISERKLTDVLKEGSQQEGGEK